MQGAGTRVVPDKWQKRAKRFSERHGAAIREARNVSTALVALREEPPEDEEADTGWRAEYRRREGQLRHELAMGSLTRHLRSFLTHEEREELVGLLSAEDA